MTSEPESGARVLIDGEEVGETPYRSDRLKSGEHRIEVLKAMYAPASQMVTVTDGHTLPVRMQLSANYGTLTFQTDASSEIWINNEKKGEGSWSGRLNAGIYILEVRRPFHRSVRQSLEVKAGDVRTLSLGSPEPIYGILNISSSPGDAEIWIDGRSYGTTPRILKDILIGEHTLELKKEGCARVSRLISVEEGKVLPVHLTLSSGRSVTLQTDREGDILYVDGKRIGVSPQAGVVVRYTYDSRRAGGTAYGEGARGNGNGRRKCSDFGLWFIVSDTLVLFGDAQAEGDIESFGWEYGSGGGRSFSDGWYTGAGE